MAVCGEEPPHGHLASGRDHGGFVIISTLLAMIECAGESSVILAVSAQAGTQP